ncbi:hypothetical protein Taro_043647 [Colocasia esculenta]|uniref:Uncharacterized protein n=1 Tax=Colocasia esculenta TaxID=4460 RepID=A0A843WWB1_COLES|nr:hypothetical protein [Colocasia esculenta]
MSSIHNKLEMSRKHPLLFLCSLLVLPVLSTADCECTPDVGGSDKSTALKLKIVSIASILAAGGLGVFIPMLGRWVSALRPERDLFFVIKAFAAGVILATGLIHILPDAFDNLTSPCLSEDPWQKFPFAGFVAMVSALGTLIIDTCATSFYNRAHFSKAQPVDHEPGDEEAAAGEHASHVHVHSHATHGHTHGAGEPPLHKEDTLAEQIRHRVVSQVLELGIVVHSVIIGISLGASMHPSIIRPLVVALSFHQFFEGMGLGGCIVQAKFKVKATVVMALFFCLTTPAGIALGIAISSRYDENSTKALIIEGLLNAASAGILIYMALVDLLAADFMNPKLQNNGRLQMAAYLSLLLGAGLMSLIAKWA